MAYRPHNIHQSWERIEGVVGAIPLGGIVASIPRRIGPGLEVN